MKTDTLMYQRLIPLFLLFFMSTLAIANDNIPENVRTAFEQMFPDVHKQDVFWEVRKDAIVATFNEEGGLKKAFFAEDGEWLETRIRLYTSQLPRAVYRYLEKTHRHSDITFLAKVLHPGGYFYRIESETFEEVVIEFLDRTGALMDTQQIRFTEGLELY